MLHFKLIAGMPRMAAARLSRTWLAVFAALFGLTQWQVQAQISTVVFQDDFSASTIDASKYTPSAPFFEGGVGDIRGVSANGTIEFVGTTTTQWWSGATLRIAPVFSASESAPLTLSIDRVAEAGVGTASRSALWILNEARDKYVLFADVRGEGGWRFNRKIGENGDVPTGSGTDIALFNGGTYDDGLLHKMGIIADGKTVKLMVDGVIGQEVKFPFNKVVFEFGSYARANNDTAATTWDNLKIEINKPTAVVFQDDFSAATISPGKFQADAPFFEGGKGDFQAQITDGTVEFVGTTTTQWWAGGTLRIVPTFNATEETPVKLTLDRVSEAGVGTASRSALWVLDETGSKYVLFADVRGEGGWRYNRKIGENGDVPTGSGTDIAAFNGASFDDGGKHVMSILADGKTVKLILDGIVGAEVKFPVNKLVFHIGSYARANNDTAATKFDNIKVETVLRQSTVVFQDDFAANAIDPAKFQPSAPFFEGGVGDIAATAKNGTIEFAGTTTTQWWSGGTLRVVPTFEASDESLLTLTIDRVAEAGVGSASRSALWILNETRDKYILFADVRGEGGWRYNRKIGEDGDVPTGGGNNIAAFDGAAFDNGGLRKMSMVANGKTVKLLLDGIVGAEVKFPFSPVVFEFGSYARANNDTASTIWDNIKIETEGGAAFVPKAASVRVGQVGQAITVRIPAGLNSTAPVNVRVVSGNPAIATPEGGTAGSLNMTFAAGAANTQTFRIRGVAIGGTTFSVEGDIGSPNPLSVAVISEPGVVLEEAFGGAIDAAKWQTSDRAFEAGTGTYTVTTVGGKLQIDGSATTSFWSGASLKSVKSFLATKDLNLVVEVDRSSIVQAGSAGRTGVYLTTGDHSKYVFFAQNLGENGWQVNVNPGTATGGGNNLALFDAQDAEPGDFKLKLVADGSNVEVFLNGVSGGRFPFEVTSGIFVELGAYARAEGDTVTGTFDNVRIENVLPCTSAEPSSVSLTVADRTRTAMVTVPQLLNDAAPVTVRVTSANPAVAIPAGAVNGVLTLTFAAGAANSQPITISPVGFGTTTFSIATTPASCVAGTIAVEVVAFPKVLLTDAFATLNNANWSRDNTPFESGELAEDSDVAIVNGEVKFTVKASTSPWPAISLLSAKTYAAKASEPITFEITRNLLEFDLTTGTGAEQRSYLVIKEPGGNFVHFSEHVAHDGRNFGWGYNKQTGAADDNPTGNNINIRAFDAGTFDNQKAHKLKLVANGASVKLFLDDVFGAEVPFAFGSGLTLGFGGAVDETGNVARVTFDNATIKGESAPPPASAGSFTGVTVNGGNITINWTGGGALQSTDALTPPSWSNVTPAPTGTSLTVPAASQAAKKFYRLFAQ